MALASALPERSSALRIWRWRVFVSTWLCYVGMYFCRKPFSVVKSAMGTELAFSAWDLALIGTAYLVAYTVGQFLSGAIGPRLGPRVMLLTGMAISIGCAFAFGLTDAFVWFVVLMIVNGLAQAVGWSNCVGTMASWFHRGERGTVMGIWATCFQVGNVVAPALAAWVLHHYGFRYAFFAGAVVLMGVWLVVFFNQANHPEDKGLPPVVDPRDVAVPLDPTSASGAVGTPVRWSRQVWITVLLVGGAYFGMKFIRYALDSWAPFFLARNFGLADDDAGYVSTVFGMAGIGGVMLSGWASDRLFNGRRATLSFLLICGVVASTIAMVTVGTQTAMAFAVCVGLIGFTLYGPDALLTGAGAMDIGGGHGAVRAAGIISGLGSAGSVVQELLIGKLYTQSGGAIGPVLATLLGSALLTAACLGAILVRNRRGLSDV